MTIRFQAGAFIAVGALLLSVGSYAQTTPTTAGSYAPTPTPAPTPTAAPTTTDQGTTPRAPSSASGASGVEQNRPDSGMVSPTTPPTGGATGPSSAGY